MSSNELKLQDEINQLKAQVDYLEDIIEANITEIKKDITDLRVRQGHTEEQVQENHNLIIGRTQKKNN